jgi:hypothetical protein
MIAEGKDVTNCGDQKASCLESRARRSPAPDEVRGWIVTRLMLTTAEGGLMSLSFETTAICTGQMLKFVIPGTRPPISQLGSIPANLSASDAYSTS